MYNGTTRAVLKSTGTVEVEREIFIMYVIGSVIILAPSLRNFAEILSHPVDVVTLRDLSFPISSSVTMENRKSLGLKPLP